MGLEVKCARTKLAMMGSLRDGVHILYIVTICDMGQTRQFAQEAVSALSSPR